MKLFIVVLCCVIVAVAYGRKQTNKNVGHSRKLQRRHFVSQHSDKEFVAYQRRHGKNYRDEHEEAKRYRHYSRAKAVVDKHNAERAQGEHTYGLKMNDFADMSYEERKSRTGQKPMPAAALAAFQRHHKRPSKTRRALQTPPTNTMDWTTTGFVPPVKNQGTMGNCWAFSSTDCLAYYYGKSINKPMNLSIMQVTECNDNTCNAGGMSWEAFSYVQKNGVESEADYPLTQSCGPCSPNAAKSISVFANTIAADPAVESIATMCHACSSSGSGTEFAGAAILNGAEYDLAGYLASTGPAVLSIYAVCDQFQLWDGIGYLSNVCATCTCALAEQAGEITASQCGCGQASNTDHAVLGVGYLKASDGTPYYRIKNSWGPNCGDHGYWNVKAFSNEVNIAFWGAHYPIGITSGTAAATTAPATPAAKTTTAAAAPTTTAAPAQNTTTAAAAPADNCMWNACSATTDCCSGNTCYESYGDNFCWPTCTAASASACPSPWLGGVGCCSTTLGVCGFISGGGGCQQL